METMLGTSFVEGFMSYIRYLCLFTYSGVQHMLRFVFLRLVCPVLPLSLGCPFLLAPSVFSNVYLMYTNRLIVWDVLHSLIVDHLSLSAYLVNYIWKCSCIIPSLSLFYYSIWVHAHMTPLNFPCNICTSIDFSTLYTALSYSILKDRLK